MSLYSEYMELRKKRIKEESEEIKANNKKSSSDKKTASNKNTGSNSSKAKTTTKASSKATSLLDDYLGYREKRVFENTDIAPVSERVRSRVTTDIAPTKKEKWFQKGAFEDGYDFGDITRTILGTTADLGQDLTAGALGFVEKGIDFFAVNAGNIAKGMYYQNGGGYNVEQDKMFEESLKASQPVMENFVKKDIIKEEKISKAIISGDYEKQSVLAEKADQTVQSGGQLLATAGLQAVGVPWWLTTGVTAWGAEAENALNQGATTEEANLSGAISAGAEVLTEKIFGGIKFGGKALDDALTQQIARGISNKFVRNLAKLGLDAAGEGAEEWITEDINKFGQWLTYRSEEELKELLFSEEAMDEKIDAFIGGALLGGVSNVGNAINSKRKGIDSVTGRTNNEEAVVKKVYEDLIAEAQKDGKVTAKEKSKIYDRVTRELEKGGISTDTIEELLDEEGYKAYQAEKDNFFKSDSKKSYDDALRSEQAELDQLKKKLDELTDAPNTVGNNRVYDSVVSRMTELQENPGSNAIKAQLDQEVKRINQMHNDLRTKVHDMVKGTKLEESYNELIRSNEKYTADVSQYKNEHAKKTIENILKSGMGDNTTKFHEYADWLAQISADKGMSFSLTNDKALRGTEHDFSAEGLKVNGFVTEDGITLNMDSPKALNSTVGHEVTHVLEQTELYQTLQDTVFKYEIAKNGQDAFDKRLKAIEARYQGKNADAKAELTADLVGDYLFTDYDFVHNLSTENRNVFQKVYDEIKYLCKVVTAGSKEARELEKVKKVFEDAYRANVNGKADTKTQLSLSDSNIKDTSTGYSHGETYYTMSYEQDGKVVATLEYGDYDGAANVKMIEVDPEYRRKGIATKLMQELQNKYPDTEINFGMATPDGAKLLDSITYDVTDEAVVADRQKLKNLQAELDELQGKLDALFEIENLTEEQHAELETLGDRWQEVYEEIIKLDKDLRGKKATRTFVKTDAKYSLSEEDNAYFDAVGNSDWETAERMVDEAAKKAGYTKAVYHGTDARFTVFDTDEESTAREEHAWMADYPDGTIFLAEDYDVADGYGDRVMPLYLDTTDMKVFEEPDMYAHRAMDDMYGYEVYNYPVIAVKGKDMTIYATLDNTLVKSSDTVTYGDGGEIVPLSERFKHSNPDIRYSLSDTNGRELSNEQSEYFKDSKARDENGNLQVVYHGTRNADFTVFKRNATYFTDNKDMADSYAPSGEIFEGYVNITKPYEIDAQGERWSKIPVDAEMKKFLQEYGSSVFKEGGKWRTSTADIVAAIEESVDNGDMDYDGIIIKNIDDTGTYHKGKATHLATDYIVFNSNQFKNADNKTPTSDLDIRYSLTEYTAEEKKAHNKAVLDHFGKTYKWAETGYLLLDGSKLDLSGKHEGAPGGYRTVDHRDISVALGYDYGGDSYSGSLVQFMGEGNIRIIPECNGINLSVKPTRAQEMALSDFVSRARGEVILDIDGLDGYTEVSVEYPRGTHANKVLNDIRAWFENGTKPEVSNLSQFRSLSKRGANPKEFGDWNVYGSDFGSKGDDFAPVIPTPNRNVLPGERMSAAEMFPDEPDVSNAEYDNLVSVKDALENRMLEMSETGDFTDLDKINEEWVEAKTRLAELEAESTERADSLTDADAPPEMEAPYYESNPTTLTKKATADIVRDVRASLDVRNNEVSDLKDIVERYRTGKIQTREQLVDALQDKFGTYKDTEIDERLAEVKKAIRTTRINVSDTIKHGIADYAHVMRTSRGKVLFAKNGLAVDEVYKELQEQFPDFFNEDAYLNPEDQLLHIIDVANTPHVTETERYKDIGNIEEAADLIINGIGDFKRNQDLALSNKESKQAFESLVRQADRYAPMDDIAPVKPTKPAAKAPAKAKPAAKQTSGKVAQVLTKASKKSNAPGIGGKVVSALVDKGAVFEKVSLDSKNMEVQAKWQYALPTQTEARAQYFMENGENGTKSLKSVMKEVNKSKKTDLFQEYLYQVHNIDRMTLEDRFGVPNKAVYGDTITADISRKKAARLLKANPEFKRWAQDIYNINKQLRSKLVEGGLITQEVASLWEKMYPHYVPITRVDANGLNVNVPLDTNKTGVNNPVKRATGGNSDIEPLFNTMAQRIEQTYRAIARNSFGIELKNTLGTAIDSNAPAGVDEIIDTIEAQEESLLKPGTVKSSPTFTVFENGERVEFEITEDMYDALKPTNKILAHRNPVIKWLGDNRRNLLTVWNPVFALYRNPIKDIQDVAINSQHAVRTYANVPNAMFQIAFGGKYADEYHQNGGKSNTYFDGRKNKFKTEDNLFKKTIGMPLRAIENAGEFIEEIPRLAEYIASRKQDRSIERSMLDAARVTTNFAAGGDFTKFLNGHGFTFLNASVQGASQHVRNFREATKLDGLKGFTKTLAKYVVAGVPGIILNSLLWDDDEEYEELSDYVKENYFVVAKTDDGKFIRIPKGRTTAVMQNLMEQMQHLVTGDDEADFSTFFELFMNNIAPNNPLENNILAPVVQTVSNNAWYGGDIVPSRLQDLPAEEQFDESTDSISKWLGEKTGLSPIKLNYLLDQYSGGLGDVVLPMLTPEAESGDNSALGNILAPWKKEMTTDKVLNNKNPGDFYDLKDELEVMSNSRNATEEDKMKTMYMDAVSWEMGDLYAQKREIQSSDLPDDRKYEAVRGLQEQINEIAKNAMSGYNNVSINGLYSEVGDKRFNLDKESGNWYEIKPKKSDGTDNWYYQKEQEVTKGLGISYEEYWNNREEYNYAYDNPEKYTFSKAVGGYQSFRSYTSDLWDIKADKDENGKSINGSRKEKVIDYINNMNADYGEKIILFKSEYNADDTYNEDIIEYLNGRDDISYSEMETILKYLGFDVDSKGNISW